MPRSFFLPRAIHRAWSWTTVAGSPRKQPRAHISPNASPYLTSTPLAQQLALYSSATDGMTRAVAKGVTQTTHGDIPLPTASTPNVTATHATVGATAAADAVTASQLAMLVETLQSLDARLGRLEDRVECMAVQAGGIIKGANQKGGRIGGRLGVSRGGLEGRLSALEHKMEMAELEGEGDGAVQQAAMGHFAVRTSRNAKGRRWGGWRLTSPRRL